MFYYADNIFNLSETYQMNEPTLDELGIKHGTDKSSRGHNYLKTYEFFFKQFRHEAFTLIEIGGLNGASLAVWEEYFPAAKIVCLDINREVMRFQRARVDVLIGDSGDPKFLNDVASRYENVRLIIDDGSHRWDHNRIAFTNLFSKLAAGGLYVIEDLHTNFETRYAGVDDVPFTAILAEMSRTLLSRGDVRRALQTALSPRIRAALSQTEYITYLQRSCIVAKKELPEPTAE